jgi:hypothetical protein
MINCNIYKRPINYEIKACSFDDAAAFMIKVAEKEDYLSLIKVTAIRLELNNRDSNVEQDNIETFQKLVK